MKHLGLSIAPRGNWERFGQIELTPDQVRTLRKFLAETLP